MVSVVFWEQSQMLLHFFFIRYQFFQASHWVFEWNFPILRSHLQKIEMSEAWRIKQWTIVKSPHEFQQHEQVLSPNPIYWQWVWKQKLLVIDSSCEIQTKVHQPVQKLW